MYTANNFTDPNLDDGECDEPTQHLEGEDHYQEGKAKTSQRPVNVCHAACAWSE